MSTNSLLLGTSNGVCVNSIIKDKIREYMMSDSSPSKKSSTDISSSEINKENTTVIHENKKVITKDPMLTGDSAFPSTLNVSIHNSSDPCPHRQDLVTASIRRIGNSLDALLNESKNASHVKAVKKVSPLCTQQNSDRLFLSGDQIRYRKSVTLHDICEEYIQFITVNSSASVDEEVTTTSESDTDQQEPVVEIIPVMAPGNPDAQKCINAQKTRTAQISVITVNESLPKNTTLIIKKCSVEVPVATKTECEKSNGDSNQDVVQKLSPDKNKETEENVISNGIKSTTNVEDSEKVTVESTPTSDSQQDDLQESIVNDDSVGVSKEEKGEVPNETQETSPVLSLSNGVVHENVTDEPVHTSAEPVTEEPMPESPVSIKQDETVAMEVDEIPVEDSMEITNTNATDVESESNSKQTEDELVTAEQMTSQESSKNSEEDSTMPEDTPAEHSVVVEPENDELTEPQIQDTPMEEQETEFQALSPAKPERTPSPPLSPESKISEEQMNEPQFEPEITKDDQETPSEIKDTTIVPSETQCDKKENFPVKIETKADEEPMNVDQKEKPINEVPSMNNEVPVKEEPTISSSITSTALISVPATANSETSSDLPVTTAPTISTPNGAQASQTAATTGSTKRRPDTATEDLEADRDGRISSSSSGSGSGSDAENNQDCKRIRFDESIFEEDERERLIREFVERSTESTDDIGKNCDKLQHEIAALSDLARAKELEWNSIIRLLKLKEEMLERILFKKRHLDCQTKIDGDTNLSKLSKPPTSEQTKTTRNETNIATSIANSQITVVPISSAAAVSVTGLSNTTSQELYKAVTSATATSVASDASNKLRPHRPILPKPALMSGLSQTAAQVPQSTVATVQPNAHTLPLQTQSLLQSTTNPLLVDQNSVIGEGRQGPIVDVKSIIAEYRSKNPEPNQRRGRRNIQFGVRAPDAINTPRFMPNNALLSMANMALGSGSHVRTNVSSTTHNDHRPANFFLGQDSSITAALNRPDLQIRQANMDSFMLSINPANSNNSSQSNTSSASGGNAASASSVSMAPACNAASSAGSVSGSSNSFQEALVKFAKMNEKRDMASNAAASATGLHISSNKNATHLPPPPPYPEVTLHPVLVPQFANSPQNSLLHGILTKSNSGPNRPGSGGGGGGAAGAGSGAGEHHATSSMGNVASSLSASNVSNIQHRPTTFSPTLARLLTAPERNRGSRSNMTTANRNTKSALSEILNSKKTRTEVTITPVTTSTACATKNGSDIVMVDDDDESENADRLVIDEGREAVSDATSNVIPADQVPECQGCHKKAAQFVCAGCGNQWYCSRECQVQAWEEHSEMCSG